MPTNSRSFVFSAVGSGTSHVRVRTENTLILEKNRWYKFEIDLKSSGDANNMTICFGTTTAFPGYFETAHRWGLAPTGTAVLVQWYLVGMGSVARLYYQQWATETYYIKSNTNDPVYLHFQVAMKLGTDNYALKLDNFSLTRVDTEWADVDNPTTAWETATEPTTDLADVLQPTTDWTDA